MGSNRILDGHFSHIFVVKICNVCLKRPKITEKEAGVIPFFKLLTEFVNFYDSSTT